MLAVLRLNMGETTTQKSTGSYRIIQKKVLFSSYDDLTSLYSYCAGCIECIRYLILTIEPKGCAVSNTTIIVLLVPEKQHECSTNFQGKSTCKFHYNSGIGDIRILSFISMRFLDYTEASG